MGPYTARPISRFSFTKFALVSRAQRYLCKAILGTETDTLDASGSVVKTADWGIYLPCSLCLCLCACLCVLRVRACVSAQVSLLLIMSAGASLPLRGIVPSLEHVLPHRR